MFPPSLVVPPPPGPGDMPAQRHSAERLLPGSARTFRNASKVPVLATAAVLIAALIFGVMVWGRQQASGAFAPRSRQAVELYFTNPTVQGDCATSEWIVVDFTVAGHVASTRWLSYRVTVRFGRGTETRRGEMVVADDAPHRVRVGVPQHHSPAEKITVLLDHRPEQITLSCTRANG